MQLLSWIVTRDRWLYGMKTKDDMLKVIKIWFSAIAEIRQKHNLVVVMRDNAEENKSHEIMGFIQSQDARNHFSSSYKQWQNGLAESEINSNMRLARTVMAESGLGGGSGSSQLQGRPPRR
jgi:hypothetical protein